MTEAEKIKCFQLNVPLARTYEVWTSQGNRKKCPDRFEILKTGKMFH